MPKSTAGMPKSLQNAMKCVWMSPFVERPQMKKVANNAQKAGWREASMSMAKAAPTALPPMDGAGATGPSSP